MSGGRAGTGGDSARERIVFTKPFVRSQIVWNESMYVLYVCMAGYHACAVYASLSLYLWHRLPCTWRSGLHPFPIVGRMWRCRPPLLHSVVQSGHPTITERQREIGQGRDTQHSTGEEKKKRRNRSSMGDTQRDRGRSGYGRSG